MQPLNIRRETTERNLVARPWGRSCEGDVLQVTAVKEKPRRHNRSPRGRRDLSRLRRGTCPLHNTHGLPHDLATTNLSTNTASDDLSIPQPAERSLVAGPWGRSCEGDVLQVTAVKEKPRRHNRSPRGCRDLSRLRRGTCPLLKTHGLPHDPVTAPNLSANTASDGLSMPFRAPFRAISAPPPRKLHTAAFGPGGAV